jgi:hypothetical protein
MDETLICQSCGMPMASDEQMGTEANGGKSREYCVYCYQDGKFTHDITLDEMIENNLVYLDEWNRDMGTNFTVDEARAQLSEYLPLLKRWHGQ